MTIPMWYDEPAVYLRSPGLCRLSALCLIDAGCKYEICFVLEGMFIRPWE